LIKCMLHTLYAYDRVRCTVSEKQMLFKKNKNTRENFRRYWCPLASQVTTEPNYVKLHHCGLNGYGLGTGFLGRVRVLLPFSGRKPPLRPEKGSWTSSSTYWLCSEQPLALGQLNLRTRSKGQFTLKTIHQDYS